MTREEELDWLCRLRSEIYVYMPKEWLIPMNNALDMAISALSENSNSDRAEVQAYFDGQAYGWEQGRKALIDDVTAEIEALPKTYPFVNHIDTYVKEDDVLQILDNIGKTESEDKE